MAGIQRMIKSGIRLFNHNPRAINFTASPINRLGSSANSYRWLCSSSCGDGHSNVKRTFNVDTCAMVNALKSEGITPEKAKAITSSMTEFVAELEKESEALKESIRKLKMIIWVVGAALVVVTADTIFSRKILNMLSLATGTTMKRTPFSADLAFRDSKVPSGTTITRTPFRFRITFPDLK